MGNESARASLRCSSVLGRHHGRTSCRSRPCSAKNRCQSWPLAAELYLGAHGSVDGAGADSRAVASTNELI